MSVSYVRKGLIVWRYSSVVSGCDRGATARTLTLMIINLALGLHNHTFHFLIFISNELNTELTGRE